MKQTSKKIILASSIIILLGIMVSLFFIIRAENKDFSENGVSVSATILEKREMDDDHSSKRVKMRYVFRISFFTEPQTAEKPKEIEPDSSENNKSEIDKKLDDIFGDPNRERFGDYTTTELNVNSDKYLQYNVGDKIRITYLKDSPAKVRIAEEEKGERSEE